MFLFPEILVLRNTGIHICFLNSCNVLTNIKASINKVFCFGTALKVSNINSNHSHVRFGESLDNSVMEC